MNLTGQSLGTYKLERVIGRGPRATVYRARQSPGDRLVAVKVYDESVDPDRIRQAAESTQALTQPHTLIPDEVGVHRGLAWAAMRYMPIGSIASRWRGGAPIDDLARIVPQIAQALNHAHEHGVLHGNLKPTNILLDHPGNAFVADFGLPTRGDSPYAAPEIGRAGTADDRCDVYSLGAVLYALLTGREPVARRPRDESINQRMADLPSPRSIRPGIPPALEAVVMRAMSIDPHARHATPGALAVAFAEAVQVAAQERPASSPRRMPAGGWLALGVAGLAVLAGVVLVSSGLNAPAKTPSPTITRAATQVASPTQLPSVTAILTPARSPTRQPTRTPAAAQLPPITSTISLPTQTPTTAARAGPTLSGSIPPQATTATTPLFTVASLKLRPFPAQSGVGEQLALYFDVVVQPSTGGPFGQLFGYLPTADSAVTTRIGAQISSGTQLVKVTLIVDCAQVPPSFTTHQIRLEIRPSDRGPTLYATTIDYTKTWCR